MRRTPRKTTKPKKSKIASERSDPKQPPQPRQPRTIVLPKNCYVTKLIVLDKPLPLKHRKKTDR
jgi:hypothetical protein